MEYKLDFADIAKLAGAVAAVGATINPLINTAFRASALKVQSLGRRNAPHRTGTLQRSILPEFADLYAEVKVNEKYGVWLEEGTEPYEIRPRNAKALFWPGAAHPVMVVHHPGLKARPFFAPAIEEAQPFIKSQYAAATQAIVDSVKEKMRA